ncbi:MAG: potassium transporter Kup [Chrysiogenetes bacterium]|nr:potassium transporter Kup [Chrysiogenetes bacterium]
MDAESSETPKSPALPLLAYTALGVVYGDIGTSPLYALRECFNGPHSVHVAPENVLGILSLIFWALVLIISIKYLVFILRADHEGEGGILALMVLATRSPAGSGKYVKPVLIALGLFGAALLYGDGVITPAISVLSAIEGLSVATPVFDPYVDPITIVILVFLFLFQYRGTAGVGVIFAPLTLLWFVVLAALGIPQIIQNPAILQAANPLYGIEFFAHNGWHGATVLGAVVLVVTGGEALYADMGHFGANPIRLAWFTVVLPSLLINYFGQGALLLSNPEAASNPFYLMAPGWALYPLVGIATVATIIASQAVITGAFSLTSQAVQMGYLPRFEVRHTSEHTMGQIYLPRVNWVLLALTIWLVLNFHTSANLAAAYGIAVTTTMVITSILAAVAMRGLWNWSLPVVIVLTTGFLIVDGAFFGANALKFFHGGWFPILIAAVVYISMATWKRGREILGERLQERTIPFHDFLFSVEEEKPARVPGTAIVMTGYSGGTPVSLLHNYKLNRVLHERVVFLTIETMPRPYLTDEERVIVTDLGKDFFGMIARYGYLERPDVSQLFAIARKQGFDIEVDKSTFLLGRETLRATKRPGMALWRERLFSLMSRNALPATAFFGIPAGRVLEIGVQVDL